MLYIAYLIYCTFFFFFFKQKTAYEMRISDWSSDVCSSDLIPAIDRYDGPLWQTLRAIGPDRPDTKIAVLSARYGFIDSRSPIENYDTRLTAALAERLIEGGIAMRWPRPPLSRKPDIYGNYATCEIASLTDHGERPFTEIGLAGEIGRASCRKECVSTCRSRRSPTH